jgi:dipeptidyl aminopeptidase/acylaminoacyl peptidase
MTKRNIRMVIVALLVSAAVASAQEARRIRIPAKQPLTHETMWLMKRVGAPSVSPDGRSVVFSVTEPAYDEKEQTADLWIVPADGSASPRKLTATKASESDVAWSPDSRRIAFSSKREGDEVNQIYVLTVAEAGEAQRVTNVSTGARSPQFRPDGGAILFTSTVYPGAADDEANKKAAKEKKDQKYKVRVYESFPVRNWDRWMDDQQPHIFVQSLQSGAKAVDVLAGTQLVAMPGFAGRGGGEGGREDIDSIWTPDGKGIVFVATSKRNESAYAEVPGDLYRIALDGDRRSAEPVALTQGTGDYGRVKFSPDGRTLFATYSPNNKLPFNNSKLVRFDWSVVQASQSAAAGAAQPVSAALDRSVDTYVVTPDSQTVYFTAEDAGLVKLYSVRATGGDVQQAVDQDEGVYRGLSIATRAPSTVLVANWGSSVHPAEVVRIDPAAKATRGLTDFNVVQSARIDWLPPQHFWFTNKEGMKIHSMLVMPPAFDDTQKYPLLVLMHGGAANMWTDSISLRWNYHLLASPGYVVLLTDYRGSTGYGDKFAQAIQGDPLKGPAKDINDAADEAIKRFPFIDGTRQAAAGASYGGHLANWMEASTTRYKCLISHAGLVNLETQWGTSDSIYHRELMAGGPVWEQGQVWKTQNPIRYAKNFKTPILLSVGERDFRVPLNNTLENWSALQRMRVPSRLLVWPDENHWILNADNSRYFYKEVADWLAKWL